jgi:hypothetical protein
MTKIKVKVEDEIKNMVESGYLQYKSQSQPQPQP